MEQSQINKLTIGGVAISAIIGLVALGLVITVLVRNDQKGDVLAVEGNTVPEEPVLTSRGFVGKPTSNTLRAEGSLKVLELKGHISNKEIPGYEPVNDSDTEVRAVRIGEQTKITKITSIAGKPPVIEEFSASNLVAAEVGLVYLARYEAMGPNVSLDAPAAFLEIYSLPKAQAKR